MRARVSVCVRVRAHACLLRAPAACSLRSWGGRRGHQKARAGDPAAVLGHPVRRGGQQGASCSVAVTSGVGRGVPVGVRGAWTWGCPGCGVPWVREVAPSSLAVVLQGSLPLPGGADPHGGSARALVRLGSPQSLLPLLRRRRGHQEAAVQQPEVLPGGGPAPQVREGGGATSPLGAAGRLSPLCLLDVLRPAFGGRACVGADLQAVMCNTQVGRLPSGPWRVAFESEEGASNTYTGATLRAPGWPCSLEQGSRSVPLPFRVPLPSRVAASLQRERTPHPPAMRFSPAKPRVVLVVTNLGEIPMASSQHCEPPTLSSSKISPLPQREPQTP